MPPTLLPPPHAAPPAPPGAPGPSAAAPARPRLGDGLLTGTAAAGVGGALWWAIATRTQFGTWQALSLVMGVVIGLGVLLGARRGGAGPAVIAGLLAMVAIPVVVYFIDRTLLIDALADDGQLRTVPLWGGAEAFVDATRNWAEYEPARALGWALGPAAAIAVAALGRR